MGCGAAPQAWQGGGQRKRVAIASHLLTTHLNNMIAQTATKTTVASPVLKTHKVHQEKKEQKEHVHHTHIHIHAAKPVVAAKPAVADKTKLSFSS